MLKAISRKCFLVALLIANTTESVFIQFNFIIIVQKSSF